MRIHSFVGAILALSALGSGVSAADLPSRYSAPLMPVAPLFTWTGFYVGVHGGYSFAGDNNVRVGGTPYIASYQAVGAVPASLKTSNDGFVGGGQIGYNYQIGTMVYGLEADVSFSDAKGAESSVNPFAATNVRQDLRTFGTVRGRLGYTPAERILLYVTGGVAFGDVKYAGGVTTAPTALAAVVAPGRVFAGSKTDTQMGWTVGGGLEYALTNSWTVKTEYLYYNLGKKSISAPQLSPVGSAENAGFRFETKGHIVRAGLNYKF